MQHLTMNQVEQLINLPQVKCLTCLFQTIYKKKLGKVRFLSLKKLRLSLDEPYFGCPCSKSSLTSLMFSQDQKLCTQKVT